jgi:hypothetical protein
MFYRGCSTGNILLGISYGGFFIENVLPGISYEGRSTRDFLRGTFYTDGSTGVGSEDATIPIEDPRVHP